GVEMGEVVGEGVAVAAHPAGATVAAVVDRRRGEAGLGEALRDRGVAAAVLGVAVNDEDRGARGLARRGVVLRPEIDAVGGPERLSHDRLRYSPEVGALL